MIVNKIKHGPNRQAGPIALIQTMSEIFEKRFIKFTVIAAILLRKRHCRSGVAVKLPREHILDIPSLLRSF